MFFPLSVVKADRVDEIIYSTSFETEEEQAFWDLTGDLDGDGYTWMYQSLAVNNAYTTHDSNYMLYSNSKSEEQETLTPDNLAISDLITIEGYNIGQDVRINWYAAIQSIAHHNEQYSVYIFKGMKLQKI